MRTCDLGGRGSTPAARGRPDRIRFPRWSATCSPADSPMTAMTRFTKPRPWIGSTLPGFLLRALPHSCPFPRLDGVLRPLPRTELPAGMGFSDAALLAAGERSAGPPGRGLGRQAAAFPLGRRRVHSACPAGRRAADPVSPRRGPCRPGQPARLDLSACVPRHPALPAVPLLREAGRRSRLGIGISVN